MGEGDRVYDHVNHKNLHRGRKLLDTLFSILVFIIVVWVFANHINNNTYIFKRIDGVETIDGITYLVPNIDIKGVMERLEKPRHSKMIKYTTFERLGECEGILTFGGVAYSLNNSRPGADMDIGAAYKVSCIPKDKDTIVQVKYEGRDYKYWYSKWCKDQPDIRLNQAYHRFFKEQLFVRVIKDTGETND